MCVRVHTLLCIVASWWESHTLPVREARNACELSIDYVVEHIAVLAELPGTASLR